MENVLDNDAKALLDSDSQVGDSDDSKLGQRKRVQYEITPLTLWLPIKQDAASQSTAASLVAAFKPGKILTPVENTHFFRVISIPNNDGNGLQGIVIASIFDGTDYNAYLAILWGWTAANFDFKSYWPQFCSVMTNPPADTTSLAGLQAYAADKDNMLSKQSDLSYGYTASAREIAWNPALPIARTVQVNPLSLFVPMSQTGVRGLFGRNALPIVKNKLSGNFIPKDTFIHFALVAIIPNPPGVEHKYSGFLLLTCFDGPMEPYLDFFWTQKAMRDLWKIVCGTATNIDKEESKANDWPDSPVKFKSYINENNRSTAGDLSGAYTASLPDIFNAYPITMPAK
jgi:hypothetical protein